MSKCDHAYIYNNIRMSTVDEDGHCNMCGEYIPESRYIVPPSITGGTSEER